MKTMLSLGAATVLLLGVMVGGTPQSQPEVIKRVDPVYPKIYLLAGIEGEVYIHATIDETGKVEQAVITNATDKGFGPPALDAIKQWVFKPATLEGRPIKAEVTIPVKFKISDASLPPGELVTLRQKITTFLEHGALEDLIQAVDTSAYAIIGGRYAMLLGLLKDRSAMQRLSGGANEILFSHLKTDAASDAAFMEVHVKSDKADRYHTIVLMKDVNDGWKIVSWHVSP